MIFIREAISYVSKVSTYETKHFLICIMYFQASPRRKRPDDHLRVHKMAFITVMSEVFVSVSA